MDHLFLLAGIRHCRGDNPIIKGGWFRWTCRMVKLPINDWLSFGRYRGSSGRWHPWGCIERSVHRVLGVTGVEVAAQHFRELLRSVGQVA